MSGWAERIHAALLETDDAFSALHAARAAGEPTATLDRLSQEAANRSNKMIAACRDALRQGEELDLQPQGRRGDRAQRQDRT